MPKLLAIFFALLFVIEHTSCTKKCSNCTVRQVSTCTDSTIVGYPSDVENTSRYCDAQVENLKQSQGTFSYDYPKGNGNIYTITEVVIVKCY